MASKKNQVTTPHASSYLLESCVFIVAATTIFYYVSLLTFHPDDPSYYHVRFPELEKIYNLGGAVGAELSAHALTWFGDVAILIPVLFLFSFFMGARLSPGRKHVIKSLGLGVILFPVTLACASLISALSTGLFDGGWFGDDLSFFVTSKVGTAGGWLLSVTTCFVLFNIYTKKRPFIILLSHLTKKMQQARSNLSEKMRKIDFIRAVFKRKKSTVSGAKKIETTEIEGVQTTYEKPRSEENFPPNKKKENGSFLSSKIIAYFKSISLLKKESKEPQNQASFTAPAQSAVQQSLAFQDIPIPNSEKDHGQIKLETFSTSQERHPAQNPQRAAAAHRLLERDEQGDLTNELEQKLWEGNTPESVNYTPPSKHIFKSSSSEGVLSIDRAEMNGVGETLVKTLLDFGVTGKIIGYQPGPVVTVYEFSPDAGIKQSKLTGLIDDIALALKVDSILIQPVKGKRALGVQVPNSKRQVVYFGDLMHSSVFEASRSPLTFAMGKSLDGKPVAADLTSMPHLLVAGATGSGKSVGINALICSIVMKASPAEVKMILVDPKMLELSVYEGIPHLLMPVITEPTKASLALRWAVGEMERRYKIMQNMQVRNIQAFNAHWKQCSPAEKIELRNRLEDQDIDHLPFIVLVIDELADLMLTAPKEVESIIQRLAQKARASGIHMVLATQRPSVDIITGVIKANLPSRIAFQVVSKHDSRTILDQMGADKLLGKGDMLFQRPGKSKLDRIQGAFISDEEVVSLVDTIKKEHSSLYSEDLMDWIASEAKKTKDSGTSDTTLDLDDDPKWDEAITIGQRNGQISASFLQRQLKIGYNRAARIVEAMEAQGLVEGASGSKPRKWKGPLESHEDARP